MRSLFTWSFMWNSQLFLDTWLLYLTSRSLSQPLHSKAIYDILTVPAPHSFKIIQGLLAALFFTSNSPLHIWHYYFASGRPNNCVIFHLCFIVTKRTAYFIVYFYVSKRQIWNDRNGSKQHSISLSIYFWNLIVFLNCAHTLILIFQYSKILLYRTWIFLKIAIVIFSVFLNEKSYLWLSTVIQAHILPAFLYYFASSKW